MHQTTLNPGSNLSLLPDLVCMLSYMRQTTLNPGPDLPFSKQQPLKLAHFFYMAILGSHIGRN